MAVEAHNESVKTYDQQTPAERFPDREFCWYTHMYGPFETVETCQAEYLRAYNEGESYTPPEGIGKRLVCDDPPNATKIVVTRDYLDSVIASERKARQSEIERLEKKATQFEGIVLHALSAIAKGVGWIPGLRTWSRSWRARGSCE